MSIHPYKIKNINFNNIRLGKLNGNGNKKSILLKYDDEKKGVSRFLIQTPELKFINNLKNKKNWTEIDILLNGKSEKKVNEFISFLKNLDEFLINEGKKNSKIWFGDSTSIKYKSIIRNSIKTDELFKNGIVKLKILPGTKITRNHQTQNINLKDLQDNTSLKMILEIYALWISEMGFGLYLKPILIDERKVNNEYDNIKFLEDSEDNDILNEIIDTEIPPTQTLKFNYSLKSNIKSTENVICSNIDTNVVAISKSKDDVEDDITTDFANNDELNLIEYNNEKKNYPDSSDINRFLDKLSDNSETSIDSLNLDKPANSLTSSECNLEIN